jgi:hypothetical protein
MREGSEKVLFLVYRLVAVGGSSAASVLISSVSSLVAGCAVIAFTYVGLVMIPPRHLFRVSPALTRFLATEVSPPGAFCSFSRPQSSSHSRRFTRVCRLQLALDGTNYGLFGLSLGRRPGLVVGF